MDSTKKQLVVFGYGLGVLIPYLVLMHSLRMGFGIAFLGLVGMLFIISKIDTQKIPFTLVLFGLYIAIAMRWKEHPFGVLSITFLALSLVSLIVSMVNIQLIKPVYDKWMIVAHFIGTIVTTVIMAIIFYGLFSPLGILFRIIKKDFLDRKWDPNAKTYWKQREKKAFDPERCLKQF